MTAPSFFKKTLTGLVPHNERAQEVLRKVRPNEIVKVEVKRPRSLPWLRRYWALVRLIADNTEAYTEDDVHYLLKLRCGCAVPVRERNGTVTWRPDSVAFDKMSADDWAAYWDRVVRYVETDLLPGVARADLERELTDLAGLPPAA